MCGGEIGTTGSHLAVFSEDFAFARHFVAPHLPIPSHSIVILMALAMPVKSYLKWWAIQLAIQYTADTLNYLG